MSLFDTMSGMENDLVRLHHIVAVARERRFSRAAEGLRISQPALSRSIRMFEDKHAIRIFDRGRGGVVPTAAGVQVIREAEKILQSLRELHHHVRLFGEDGSGAIRIVVAPMLSNIVLPRLSYLALRPRHNAFLEAIVPTVDQLPSMLHDERNEITFCATRTALNLSGMVVEALGAITTCALVRRNHPLALASYIDIAAALNYPTLCITDLSDSRLNSNKGGVVCTDFSVLKNAALYSDGILIGYPNLVRPELNEGSLIELRIDKFEFERSEVGVVYRRGRTLSKLARSMIEDVRKTLANLD